MSNEQRKTIAWGADVFSRLGQFSLRMQAARRPEDVYETLTEFTSTIVKAYTSMVFVPNRAGELAPAVRPGKPEVESLVIRKARSLAHAGLVTADEVAEEGGPFEAWRELFEGGSVASVAHTPFRGGEVLVLVERRRSRVFATEDWYLLRALCEEAEAALQACQAAPGGAGHPEGGARRVWPKAVLNYAWASALRGAQLSVAVVQLEAPQGSDGPEVEREFCRHCVEQKQEGAPNEGFVVPLGNGRILGLLPGLSQNESEALLERARRCTHPELRLQFGMAEYEPSARSIQQLLQAAEEQLQRASAA